MPSTNDRSTVSRRRALSATLATLVAASAASALPPRPVAAPAPVFNPAATVDREALAAWLVDWHRRHDLRVAEHSRAFEAIVDRVGDDAWSLVNALDTALGHSTNMEIDRLFALLAAHLPGVAPALRLVFDHVTDIIRGQELDCCSDVGLPPL